MADPRLDGDHLNTARGDQYWAAVDEMLDYRGPLTSAADPLARLPAVTRPQPPGPLPPGGTYALVCLNDGQRHQLRVGITAVGRYEENDIVLEPIWVSRRHCVVVVHASGGCEVTDTASRNGTFVNRRRIGRADLRPGDVLGVTDIRFAVEWVSPSGQVLPAHESSDTNFFGELSPTGH
jgi:hypothetical protein